MEGNFPTISEFPEDGYVDIDCKPYGLDMVARLRTSTNVSEIFALNAMAANDAEKFAAHFSALFGKRVVAQTVMSAQQLAALWIGPALSEGHNPTQDDLVKLSCTHGAAFLAMLSAVDAAMGVPAEQGVEQTATEDFTVAAEGTGGSSGHASELSEPIRS